MTGVAAFTSPSNEPSRRVLVQRRMTRRIICEFPAILCTLRGNLTARIIDISERGAKLQIEGIVEPSANVRLQIEGQDTYCTIIWSRDNKCGVEFERPLNPQSLSKVLENAIEEFTPIACTDLIPMGQKRRGRLVLDH